MRGRNLEDLQSNIFVRALLSILHLFWLSEAACLQQSFALRRTGIRSIVAARRNVYTETALQRRSKCHEPCIIIIPHDLSSLPHLSSPRVA